jgi:hypothetical protein
MEVKRRGFLKALATTPAFSALAQRPGAGPPSGAAQQEGAEAATPRSTGVSTSPASAGGPNTPATIEPDATGETAPQFFNAEQFAALRKLGALFAPPRNGRPGALDAGAPEFLDFLIGVSPTPQKQLYLNGLDALNDRARMQFGKSFADLNDAQADVILRPLLAVVAWELDRPAEPIQHFVFQAHEDLRTATANSWEYANSAATAASGRRGRGGAVGLYIRPLDPVYRG